MPKLFALSWDTLYVGTIGKNGKSRIKLANNLQNLRRVHCFRNQTVSSTGGRITSLEKLRVGCKSGPIQRPGCSETMSILFSPAYFHDASSARTLDKIYHCYKDGQIKGFGVHTFVSSAKSLSENQVSSITSEGVKGFRLYITEAVEDVTTTLFTEDGLKETGDAVWKTPSHPLIAGSKEFSSKLDISHSEAVVIYCDSKSAIAIAELDCHLLREKLNKGTIKLLHVGSENQLADTFTKTHCPGSFHGYIYLQMSTPPFLLLLCEGQERDKIGQQSSKPEKSALFPQPISIFHWRKRALRRVLTQRTVKHIDAGEKVLKLIQRSVQISHLDAMKECREKDVVDRAVAKF
nr:uncharacterized mitochondrial protein AtMg00810-like [Ipomoea batatas]